MAEAATAAGHPSHPPPLFLIRDANPYATDLEVAVSALEGRPCYVLSLPSQWHLVQVNALPLPPTLPPRAVSP